MGQYVVDVPSDSAPFLQDRRPIGFLPGELGLGGQLMTTSRTVATTARITDSRSGTVGWPTRITPPSTKKTEPR